MSDIKCSPLDNPIAYILDKCFLLYKVPPTNIDQHSPPVHLLEHCMVQPLVQLANAW